MSVPNEESERVIEYRFDLFLRFWYFILELFRQCCMFGFIFSNFINVAKHIFLTDLQTRPLTMFMLHENHITYCLKKKLGIDNTLYIHRSRIWKKESWTIIGMVCSFGISTTCEEFDLCWIPKLHYCAVHCWVCQILHETSFQNCWYIFHQVLIPYFRVTVSLVTLG